MDEPTPRPTLLSAAAQTHNLPDLGRLLRELRRCDARQRGDTERTYRELAAKTGWSQAAIWDYFAGRTLPPTDRFDDLVRLLGATPLEQGMLATARDRVEESRRAAGPVPDPSVGAGSVPRQLPPAVRHFVGRDSELAALDGLLDDRDAGSAAVIATIGGMAGVGKTTLAVWWAHRVRDRFPDGQLYVNLRGFGPTGEAMSPAEALPGLLDALGVSPARVPADVTRQAALYRSMLADRRVIVVLDNALDADQVRPLLPGTAGCVALITSRDRLHGLVAAEGAHPVTLDVLPAADARLLFVRRLDADRTQAEPAAVDQLVTQCARLPLALSIVAARAATQPRLPLGALAAELLDSRGALDALAGEDTGTDVRAVFSWSYRALEPVDARMFRLLGLHAGPDLSGPAGASLAGLPVPRARRSLAALSAAHLVTEHGPDRYAMHDLVRAYAGELAHAVDPEAERSAVIRRALDHYIHTGFGAAMLVEPFRTPIDVGPCGPGVARTELDDHATAMGWFTAERQVLIAATGQAATHGLDRHVNHLAWVIGDFLDRRGHYHDGLTVYRAALDAAERLDDDRARARAHNGLGGAQANLGRHAEAGAHYLRAAELNRAGGNLNGESINHTNLAFLHNLRGRPEEALRHAWQALDLSRRAGRQDTYGYALNVVGRCHNQLGDPVRGLACCRAALRITRDLGERFSEADCWDEVGRAQHQLGEVDEAIESYRRSLDLNRTLGRRLEEANTRAALGDAYHARGWADAARAEWERAARLFDALSRPEADRLRAVLGERLSAPTSA